MDFYLTLATVALSVLTTVSALRRGDDTAGWEWRWRSLDPEERRRIAAAATSTSKAERATLVDPEEVELAAGYRRRRRRRRAYIEMPVVCLLLALAALTLSGLLPSHYLGLAVALTAMGNGIVYYLDEHRRKRRRPVTVEPDASG
jgi:ferric-dicitrate binding protein FerR (iron transport regulator)